MINASELVGRPVVDMEGATRMGKIKEVIVERDGERVAGFIVAKGETIVGTGGTRVIVPASALHAIGPDAVTIRAGDVRESREDLDDLPRISDITGHKMVTRSGRVLGSIDDVLVNETDGTVIGFTVGEGIRARLENMLKNKSAQVHGYVRADADLEVGKDLIVVPDDALIQGDPSAQAEADKDEPTARPELTKPEQERTWANNPKRTANRRSIWSKRPEPQETLQTETDRPESETRPEGGRIPAP